VILQQRPSIDPNRSNMWHVVKEKLETKTLVVLLKSQK
jgi:hypothetical protein